MDIGAFISAVIYFVIFMAVVDFLIVVPYKHIQARRGQVVFGDPASGRGCGSVEGMTFRLSGDVPGGHAASSWACW